MTDGAPGAAGTPDPAAGGDEDLVAAHFERFLADLGAGRAVDLDAAVGDREDLRAQIAEALTCAAEVAVARPVERPQIPGHDVLSEIGRGGMGAVYLALDRRTQRQVAVKVLPAGYAAGPRGRERFLRETRAMARLRHPHVAAVYESGASGSVPWFSMEWLDGRTLAGEIAALRAKGPPALLGAEHVRRSAAIAADLAAALAHAHEQGVIHRDVKPANVMLRRDGRVVLFDFGLADVADDVTLTRSGDFMGTPHYAAPEQAAGAGDVDSRADIWSLGAVLYELLTLRPPFVGATAREIVRRAERDAAEPPGTLNPHVTPALAAIVLRALEKDRAARWQTARELAADLGRFLRGEETLALREPRDAATGERLRSAAERLAHGVREACAVVADRASLVAAMKSAAARGFAELGDAAAAREHAAEALAILERHAGPGSPDAVLAMAAYARAVRGAGDVAGALRLGAEAAARAQRLRDDDPARILAETHHGATLVDLGRCDEAEPLILHAQRHVPRGGAANPHCAFVADHNVGHLRIAQRRYAEAAAILDVVFAQRTAALGDDDPETIDTMLCLVVAEEHARGPDAALARSADLLARIERRFGLLAPVRAAALSNHAAILYRRGRLEEAERAQSEVVDIQRRVYGPSSFDANRSAANLARVIRARGDAERAAAVASAALRAICDAAGAGDPAALGVRRFVAELLLATGRAAEADALLAAGADAVIAGPRPPAPEGAALLESCAARLEESGRPADAARLRAHIAPAV